jgi:hypothetical protein
VNILAIGAHPDDNAIKGLTGYTTSQSRLNTSTNHVVAFEVLKLCLTKDFALERMLRFPDQTINLEEVLEGT